MPALAGTLPTSNTGGNNQTSPGVGGITPPGTRPVYTPIQGAGTVPSSNPYMATAPTSAPQPTAPGGGVGALASGTYNPATSPGYDPGVTNTGQQLTDILGKGVGGGLNYLLQNLSGTDSAIFQQWLQSQVPAQAQAEASARQGLGAMGVSGNSSVAGLMESNLASNFNATAAGVNANLMDQAIGTTAKILTGMEPLAAQQVATSGWTTFGDVMQNITGDIGALFGGKGPSPSANPANAAADAASAGSSSGGNFWIGSPDTSLATQDPFSTLPSDPGSLLTGDTTGAPAGTTFLGGGTF